MTTLTAHSPLPSSLFKTQTPSGSTVAKQTTVNKGWYSQVRIFVVSCDVALTYLPFLFSVNPGNDFAAFQAAATGGAASSAAPSATASGFVTVTATVTVSDGSAVTTTYGSYPGSAAPTAGAPTTHQVVVGGTGKLYYDPSNITAQVGDVIQFQFQQKNHTVTQVCPVHFGLEAVY